MKRRANDGTNNLALRDCWGTRRCVGAVRVAQQQEGADDSDCRLDGTRWFAHVGDGCRSMVRGCEHESVACRRRIDCNWNEPAKGDRSSFFSLVENPNQDRPQ